MAPRKKRETSGGKSGGRKKGNVIIVNFEGVDSGGGNRPTPDGFFNVEVQKVTEEEGGDSGKPYLKFQFKTHIGSVVFDNASLQSHALFSLRGLLESLGYEIPDDEYGIDIDALVGESCTVEIMNEEFDDKPQPRIVAYMPLDTPGVELFEGEVSDEPEPDPDPPAEEPDPPKTTGATRKKAPAAEKKKPAARKKAEGKLRPGSKVEFDDGEGNMVPGVLESIDNDLATVIDAEDGEWEIPLNELKKA